MMKAGQEMELYAALAMNTHEMLALLDSNYTYLEANQAYMDAFGFTKDQIIGHTMSDVFGDEFFQKSIKADAERCLAGDETRQQAWYDFPVHGSRFVNVTYSPCSTNGPEPANFVVSAHDITEYKLTEVKLKESERKSRAWLDHSPACTKILDPEFNLQFMSSAGFRALNIDDTSKLHGKPYPFDFYPEAFKNTMTANLENAVITGEVISQEAPVCDPDGRELWFHSTIVPIYDDKENLEYIMVVSIDTTERKLMEERLRQSEKLQAIGQLAGGVAHDFNNQLTAIMNFAHLAKSEVGDDSPAGSYISNIISGTKQSANLVRNLLTFARKGRYDLETVDMNRVIADATKVVRHSFPENIGIRLELNASPSVIRGDSSQLQNAIINMALNSRDAMPLGGELSISTATVLIENTLNDERRLELSPGKHLKIVISDNGSGMAPETRKRVFDPFFTTKGESTGTGMGMSSVYGTIKGHHGAIDVSSETGEGTSFTIWLPLRSRWSLSNPIPPSGVTNMGGRILIVDNRKSETDLIGMMLVGDGYEVASYGSSAEAVAAFAGSRQETDLVLLNMMMPDTDSEETYQALKRIDPKVNVLLLSDENTTQATNRLLEQGAAGFLREPASTQDIFSWITKTQRQHRT